MQDSPHIPIILCPSNIVPVQNWSHRCIFGSFGEVWRGLYNDCDVATKIIKIPSSDDDTFEISKAFCKQVANLRHLRHRNITPFCGVDVSYTFCFVSEWMPNGTISSYLVRFTGANRIKLLVDVTEGMKYLHDAGVLHGDLESSNILINGSGDACICDLGVIAVTHLRRMDSHSEALAKAGKARWMAPEILDPETFGLSKLLFSRASDIYSLAMVMWEVFTGRLPFYQMHRDSIVVIQVVLRDLRPKRPTRATTLGLSDTVWTLMEKCWSRGAKARPQIQTVLTQLQSEYLDSQETPQEWPLIMDEDGLHPPGKVTETALPLLIKNRLSRV